MKQILNKFDALHLESEISKDGMASDFYAELNLPEQTVSSDEFIRWVFTETKGLAIIEKFEQMFN